MLRQTCVSWTACLLLVQEDKRDLEIMDPEPQLTAEAIAAVQSNNRTRDRLGLDPFDVNVMAGITMAGTSPTFFQIPVTSRPFTLRGVNTTTPTITTMHRPVPNPPAVSARVCDRWITGVAYSLVLKCPSNSRTSH